MAIFKLNKCTALWGYLALASTGAQALTTTLDMPQAVTGAVLSNTSAGIQYVGRIMVPKSGLTAKDDTYIVSVKTDDKSVDGLIGPIKQVAAKSWNDSSLANLADPKNVACTAIVTTNCISATDEAPFLDGRAMGWTHNSDWYLVDLSALDNGKYDVSLKVENYNDGTSATTPVAEVKPTIAYSADLSKETAALLTMDKEGKPATTGPGFYISKAGTLPTVKTDPSTDDNLIPALTVWDGYQRSGIDEHWYPNRHQQNTVIPFWGTMLKQETTLTGKGGLPVTVGYDTAADNINQNLAQVTGIMNLTSAVTSTSITKGNRYLTVALGGDFRLKPPASSRSQNYKFTVTVTRK
jgi:hypothetical protein